MGLQKKNEKGMTLVELLAAITILGIVLLSIMYVFPQMTSSNLQTEIKLETMNLARAELVNLKEGIVELNLLDSNPDKSTFAEFHRYTYSYSGTDYVYEVDYYTEAKLQKDVELPLTGELNQVHIKVYNEDKLISETFGYLLNK